MVEMFEVLGIEAARLSVLKEMRAVLEFDGSKVNYRCAAPHCNSLHRVLLIDAQ